MHLKTNYLKIITLINFLLIIFTIAPVKAQEADDEDYLNIGGALRINLVSQHYENESTPQNTYATLDTWRINVDASYSGVVLDFEYRFYPTFNTHFIHHGYLGYNFSDDLNMQLGVTRVPFGNLNYNSNSWWFLIPYYVGLEDDYNMGIKFIYDINPKLNIAAAYFRQSDPAGPAYGIASFGGPGAGTYSYNIIPDEDGVLSETGAPSSVREMNQFNLRTVYQLHESTEVGFSGQIKGIYNSVLNDTEYGNAWALHSQSNFGNFNLKLQYTSYNYKARDDEGNLLNRIQMGAYGDPYYGDGVAARASIITAGLAYNIPVNWGPISSILPYFDYSMMTKDGELTPGENAEAYQHTYMIVPGFMITAGKVYTYVDFALGKNHPWLTDSFGTGLGAGHLNEQGSPIPVNDIDWNLRFNVNIGYYF
jgi:hypothetical protein